MNRETLLSYIRNTENIEIFPDPSSVEKKEDESPPFLLICKLKVLNQKILIAVHVTKWFPQHLPIFFLHEYNSLGFLPHILPNGSICYLEKESIYINTEKPEIVFQASVELVIKTLTDGLNGANQVDFREEFNLFWNNNKFLSKLSLSSFINVSKEPKKIQLLKNNNKKAIAFDFDKDIERQKRIYFGNRKTFSKSGLYIPLRLDSKITPPKYDQKWTIDEFVNWLRPKISSEHWLIINQSILNKNPEKFEYLVLSIPRETGSPILIGVHLKPNKKNSSYPLLKNDTGWGLDFLKVTRLDVPAFLPRSGAKIGLQEKSVLLVGCGSVGSHLALELAKAGISIIGLIDNEKIEFENLNRFSLGLQYVRMSKVNAIEQYINKNFLFSFAKSFETTLEGFLDEKVNAIKIFDLVISATGNPTINLYLNKLSRELNFPLLIGWNEPFGIGGHAQLSIPNLPGCYRCLYRDTYNFVSFAAKDQPKPFHKKHLGCGEVYTPYSSLDSIRTSELMARLAISFLTEKISKPQILSWKGDRTDLVNEGFNLSTRYNKQTQEEMNEKRFDFINEDCPHCSNKE